LKRFLGYSAVSQTLQKSQEIYNKAKTSSKLLGYSIDKVETSVQLIMDSQIGKFVDTKMNVIYDKLSVNERGNMLLDIVEEKTEIVIETAKPYYEQGKDLVEKKKEEIVQTAKHYIEQGKDLVEKKKEKIVKTAKPYYEQGKDLVEKKKEKIVGLYTWGKNSLIEKGQVIDPKVIKEQVVNLYTIGKTTLEEKNKAIKEDANKLITACQNQKEAAKQKGFEYYNQTCKYAESAKQKSYEYFTHQKETVKQTSLTYYNLATEYIKQGQKYLLNAMEKKSSSSETTSKDSKAKLLFNKTKEDLTNATIKLVDTLHQLKDNLLSVKKNGINITINALK